MLVLFAALAAVWDTALGRIPNRLLAFFWLAGVPFVPHPAYFMRGMILLLLLYPLVACRMLGAGDGKLLGVISGYLGVYAALWVLAAAGILGAAGSVCRKKGRAFWRRRLIYLFGYLFRLWRHRKMEPYAPPQPAEGQIPLALPVLGGLLLFLLWKGAGT